MINTTTLRAYKSGKSQLKTAQTTAEWYMIYTAYMCGLAYADNISLEDHTLIIKALNKFCRLL